MSNAAEVKDSTFQKEVLQADKPVLVDFWAPWCAPCRAMGPHVDKLSQEMAGKVKVVKHNTQDDPEVPGKLGVMAIPTFIVFKGGREVARHTGMLPYDGLKKLVAAAS